MPRIDARGGIGLDSEQKVYHFLRSQIATQALLPGAQIVEGQVVEQTGLSRTPVRAALRRLAYEGMVVLRPNRGAFVAKPTPKEVRDTYEALLVLETQAIELACEIISDEDIARLRQLVEESKSIFQRHDFDAFLDNNRNFHMGYVVSCRNKFLEKYIGELIVMSNIHLLVYDDFRETPYEEFDSLREHQEIVDALESRDTERCRKALVEHICNTYYTLGLPLKLRADGAPLLGQPPAKQRRRGGGK